MKYLPSFIIALLLTFSAGAASPDYKSFRGTGGITVTTNPPTGTVVIDGSGVSGAGSNFVTTAQGTATITNGLYLGQQGIQGSLYAWESVANANRRVLIMSPSGYIWGTNGVPHLVLGSSYSPAADDTTLFGGAANRWKGGYFKDFVRVDGSVNASTNVNAGFLRGTNITPSRAVVNGADGILTNAAGTPDGTKFLRDDNTYAVPAGGGAALPAVPSQPASFGAILGSDGVSTNWVPGGEAGGWVVQEEFISRADVYAQGTSTTIGNYNWENVSSGTLPSVSSLPARQAAFGSEIGMVSLIATQATSGKLFRLGQANSAALFYATNVEIFCYSSVYFGYTNTTSDVSVLRVGITDNISGAGATASGNNAVMFEQNTNATNTIMVRTSRSASQTVADTGYPYSVNTRLLVGFYVSRYWTNAVFYAGTNLASMTAIWTNSANIPGGAGMTPFFLSGRMTTSAGNIFQTNYIGSFYMWRKQYD